MDSHIRIPRERAEYKRRYLERIEKLIDLAYDGKPQPMMFCKDSDGEPIILELFLDDNELHWREFPHGRATG